jgi:hemolysin activation/secretion protein
MGACVCQYDVDASYASLLSGTPLPPSSLPSALRIMVMGCMGVSKGSSWALILQQQQQQQQQQQEQQQQEQEQEQEQEDKHTERPVLMQ